MSENKNAIKTKTVEVFSGELEIVLFKWVNSSFLQ